MRGGEIEVLERALRVLGHSNTWPREVLERSNSSLEAVLAQLF